MTSRLAPLPLVRSGLLAMPPIAVAQIGLLRLGSAVLFSEARGASPAR